MDESADSSEHQYASMGDCNADKSNADINISKATAVDKDIGSNKKVDDKNKSYTWSNDPDIKTSPFGENTGLKIVIPESGNPFFCSKLLV